LHFDLPLATVIPAIGAGKGSHRSGICALGTS
jgi:hypothetical protein